MADIATAAGPLGSMRTSLAGTQRMRPIAPKPCGSAAKDLELHLGTASCVVRNGHSPVRGAVLTIDKSEIVDTDRLDATVCLVHPLVVSLDVRLEHAEIFEPSALSWIARDEDRAVAARALEADLDAKRSARNGRASIDTETAIVRRHAWAHVKELGHLLIH